MLVRRCGSNTVTDETSALEIARRDAAAVQRHRARGDGEPQPLAASAAMLARHIHPVERLEDEPQILLRHARALITHDDLDRCA